MHHAIKQKEKQQQQQKITCNKLKSRGHTSKYANGHTFSV
jgi:hypothetical protein